MKTNLSRLRRLAGLTEDVDVMSQDDADDMDIAADNARMDRVARIEKLIAVAFKRCGIELAEDPIFYDEENDRQAIVKLYDSKNNLRALARLYETGLSDSFIVVANNHEMDIEFNVSPALDQTVESKQSGYLE